MFYLHRNQSVDIKCIPFDWFLYGPNTDLKLLKIMTLYHRLLSRGKPHSKFFHSSLKCTKYVMKAFGKHSKENIALE